MKRFFASLLAIAFLVGINASMTFAQSNISAPTTVKKSIDVEIGSTSQARFLLETNTNGAKVELRDENGQPIATMSDSGTKGDTKKNDGTYSAMIELSSDKRQVVTYTAYVDGVAEKEYQINYYRDFTASEEAAVQKVYDGINAIESEMEANGASDSAIFNAVLSHIKNSSCIVHIEVENNTIAYTSDAGISSLYARYSGDVKGAGAAANTPVAVMANGDEIEIKIDEQPDNSTLQSWTNPNVLVVRPFRNVVGEEGFHNDRYIDAAKLLTSYTKGYITVLDNEQTIPYNLLNTFWQNGFIMVDSHGLTGFEKSYMCVWDGGGYSAADMSANRIMKTNDTDHIFVSGEYFQHYYEQMNRKMDNTYLYFGICYGMTYDSLRKPFFEMGAVSAYGYDNSVSMGYEGYNLLTMYPYLTTICAEDETRTYNLEEAAAEAIKKNGDTDPYGVHGAHMVLYGNTKFVVYKPSVALTDMKITEEIIQGTVGSDCYIPVELSPKGMAYGYTEEWISSNPEVLQIVGTRMVHGKKAGEATVTAKFTFEDKVFEANCQVVVNDILPTKITATCSGASTMFKVGQTREISAEVEPLDAGNRKVGYISNNPGVVTVSDSGVVTSHRPGRSVIRVYAQANPEVYAELIINVSNDIVYAMNSELKANGTYLISTTSNSPTIMAANESDTESGCLQGKAVTSYLGYMTGNISSMCYWSFIETSGGFYIKSAKTDSYLTRGNDGNAYLSETPITVFKHDNKSFIVQNYGNDDVNTYLRFKPNSGFCFSEESGTSSRFDLSEVLDFSNNDKFATVTFNDGNTDIALQRLPIGEKAVPAIIHKVDGKTFLGWDKCLANVTNSFTTTAIMENGDSDKIIVTFKDYDGDDISRVELDAPGSCEQPVAPSHEGLLFTGWSESLGNVKSNMTVFAMYVEGKKGDVNCDLTVNTADAVAILKHSAGVQALTDIQIQFGDTNSDNKVNTADAVQILRYAAGIITDF